MRPMNPFNTLARSLAAGQIGRDRIVPELVYITLTADLSLEVVHEAQAYCPDP